MGKRKKSSRAPSGPKKREPLATTFQCLFCNHENSVTVKLQKKEGVGQLSCKVCGQSFQTGINCKQYLQHPKDLSAAVDVYSDWIDACEGVANQDGTEAAGIPSVSAYRDSATQSRIATAAKGHSRSEENLEGFIEDDEPDMEAEFVD